MESNTAKRMTEKQYNYIADLKNRAFGDGDSLLMKAISSKRERMTTRMASKVIDYLKGECKLVSDSWKWQHRGGGMASSYYALHGGLDDSEEISLLEEINAL